jgi:hypothetical protein
MAEAVDMIGHVVVLYECAQSSLVAAGLGEQRVGNVVFVTLRQAPDPPTVRCVAPSPAPRPTPRPGPYQWPTLGVARLRVFRADDGTRTHDLLHGNLSWENVLWPKHL